MKTLQQLFLTNIFLSNFYISVRPFPCCVVELRRHEAVSDSSFAAAHLLCAVSE